MKLEQPQIEDNDSGQRLLVDKHPEGTALAVRKVELPAVIPQRGRVKLRGGQLDVTDRLDTVSGDRGAARMHDEKKEKNSFVANVFQYGIFETVSEALSKGRERAKILGDESLLWGRGLSLDNVREEKQALFDQACLKNETMGAMVGQKGKEQRKFGDKPDEKVVKDKLVALLREYVGGTVDSEGFKMRKNAIFNEMNDMATDVKDGGEMFVDNAFDMAEQVRVAAETAGGLQNLDIDLELVVGRAKIGAQTERQRNLVDRCLDSLNKDFGPVGAGAAGVLRLFHNEVSVAVATGVAAGVFARGLGIGLAKAFTFGTSMLLTGAFAANKEKGKVIQQQATHQRRRAEGMEVNAEELEVLQAEIAVLKEDLGKVPAWNIVKKSKIKGEIAEKEAKADPRFAQMEQFTEVGVSASAIAGAMESIIANGELKEGLDFATATRLLGEADSRVLLSEAEKRDYLSFSSGKSSSEKLALDVARAKLKSALRKSFDANTTIDKTQFATFDAYYAGTFDLFNPSEQTGVGAEQARRKELEKKLERFADIEGVKRGILTMVLGATIGVVVSGVAQEIGSLSSHSLTGIVEALKGTHEGGAHLTPMASAVEWIQHYLGAGAPTQMAPSMHSEMFGAGSFTIPDGTHLVSNAIDGSFALTNAADGSVIVGGLHLGPDGLLDKASHHLLQAAGANTVDASTMVSTGIVDVKSEGIRSWLQNHSDIVERVHRDGWANNNTAPFDLNELLLHTVKDAQGNNTWLNVNGDVDLDLTKMLANGSFHGVEHFDPTTAIAEGKLHILISASEGSAATPVDLVVGADGHAIIDHSSDLFKTLFPTVNGNTDFAGKFIEVAMDKGTDAAGTHHVEILATHIGEGVREGITTTNTGECILEAVTKISLPPMPESGDIDWPFGFIPILPATPTLPEIPNQRKAPVQELPPAESTAMVLRTKNPIEKTKDSGEGKVIEKDKSMSKQEAYGILGIPESSTEDEVKKAYRILIQKHHPDNAGKTGAEPDAEKMGQIVMAYNLLRFRSYIPPAPDVPVKTEVARIEASKEPEEAEEAEEIVQEPAIENSAESEAEERLFGEHLSMDFESIGTKLRKLTEKFPEGNDKENLRDILKNVESANREQSAKNLILAFGGLQEMLAANTYGRETQSIVDGIRESIHYVTPKLENIKPTHWQFVDRGLAKAENTARIVARAQAPRNMGET